MRQRPLKKTTIVIWSEDYVDVDSFELDELGRDAERGDSHCSKRQSVRVEHPEDDPDWDGTEFFRE